MKREVRVALILGKELRKERVYVLAVFRGKIIEGIEFFKAKNSFNLASAIVSSKYYNEIRFFIFIGGSDPLVNNDAYVRLAKPVIVSEGLNNIIATYGMSFDEARSLLNFLAKNTFLNILAFLETVSTSAIKVLEEVKNA